MQQITDKLTVLNPGDQFPTMTTDCVKIFLAGTLAQNVDWQSAFINGVAELTDPLKGILMFKNTNFMIINPNVPAQTGLEPGHELENPEFCQKIQWCMQMQDMADVVLINIMGKSKAMQPILDFGANFRTRKAIVRCGEAHPMYPYIRLYCEKYAVPLLNGSANVKDILLTMGSFVSKFQTQQPEQAPLPA